MRLAIRMTGAVVLALMLSACDKCGNFNINMPNFDAPKSCTGSAPQG